MLHHIYVRVCKNGFHHLVDHTLFGFLFDSNREWTFVGQFLFYFIIMLTYISNMWRKLHLTHKAENGMHIYISHSDLFAITGNEVLLLLVFECSKINKDKP